MGKSEHCIGQLWPSVAQTERHNGH